LGLLMFLIIPLGARGAISEIVAALIFVLLVASILMVTSRSHLAAGIVVNAVQVRPAFSSRPGLALCLPKRWA
jgi:hypothetical protein